MTPRRLLAVLAACGAAALAASLPARAGGRVDLTSYLAPRPLVGDYRVFAWRAGDAASSYREDVVAVEDGARGWRVRWSRGGAGYTEIVRPGVLVRAEKRNGPQPSCPAAVDWTLRRCDLRTTLGASHAFRKGFLDVEHFVAWSWVRRLGRYRVVDFEPVATPTASHASAAHLAAVAKEWRARVRLGERFTIAERGPLRLDSVETTESWFVEGVGLVALRRTPGPPEQSGAAAPSYELWLEAGRVQGLPYP